MSNPNSSELRDLTARLSDGTLTTEDVVRLNELLRADPIAQEQYLDHILIDGLLEREFGGAAMPVEILGKERIPEAISGVSSASSRIRHIFRWGSTRWKWVPLVLSVLIIAGWLLWIPKAGEPRRQSLQLADAGFESGRLLIGPTISETGWYGDEADIVAHYSGVAPLKGRRMLRFVKSTSEPENACELYQIVDLRGVADVIANRRMSVEASAFFNAIVKDLPQNDYVFGITVFAFSEDPSEQTHVWPLRWGHPLSFSGAQVRADADVESWQPVTTHLPLPADTKYLIVQIVVQTGTDVTGEEFPGHFADEVALSLVSL